MGTMAWENFTREDVIGGCSGRSPLKFDKLHCCPDSSSLYLLMKIDFMCHRNWREFATISCVHAKVAPHRIDTLRSGSADSDIWIPRRIAPSASKPAPACLFGQ